MKKVSKKNNIPVIEINDENFETILVCAERYALGRRTYMPMIVINFIRPLLPYISDKTLGCLEQDVSKAESYGGYGDPDIDEPEWKAFLEELQIEIKRRT